MARNKALDVLGMTEEEQAKLSEEEVEFYSESVRQAVEDAAADDAKFREIVRNRAEAIIQTKKEEAEE